MNIRELNSFFQTADEVYAEYKKRGDCKHPVGIMLSSDADGDAFHQCLIYDEANGMVWHDQDYTVMLMDQAKDAIRYYRSIFRHGLMVYGLEIENLVYVSALRINEKRLMVACASQEKELVMRLLMEICIRHNFISSEYEKSFLKSNVSYDAEKLYAFFQK